MFESAAVLSRTAGSGEPGAIHFPSEPTLMVRGIFVVSLYFSRVFSDLGLQVI